MPGSRNAQVAPNAIAFNVGHDELVALPLWPNQELHRFAEGEVLSFDLPVIEVQNDVVFGFANVCLGQLNPDVRHFRRGRPRGLLVRRTRTTRCSPSRRSSATALVLLAICSPTSTFIAMICRRLSATSFRALARLPATLFTSVETLSILVVMSVASVATACCMAVMSAACVVTVRAVLSCARFSDRPKTFAASVSRA